MIDIFRLLLRNFLERVTATFLKLHSLISVRFISITFYQKFLDSNYFISLRFIFVGLSLFGGAIAVTFVACRMFSLFVKIVRNETSSEMGVAENLLASPLLFGIFLAAGLFVVQKLVRYSISFVLKNVDQMVRNEIGAGLFCGFIAAATLGYVFYLFLVPRFFFDNFEDSFFFEHHQKRVAAMTSFVTGQLLKFSWFYHRPFFEVLFQRNWILILFLVFFLVQLCWTYFTIVRNWRFLYPYDKRKRVVRRVLLLQLEFMGNFFVQLAVSDSRIEEPYSMVRELVDSYLNDNGKNILFVRSSFVGWWIGHIFLMIFYIKVFGLIVAGVKAYMKYYNSGRSKGDNDWDFFL